MDSPGKKNKTKYRFDKGFLSRIAKVLISQVSTTPQPTSTDETKNTTNNPSAQPDNNVIERKNLTVQTILLIVTVLLFILNSIQTCISNKAVEAANTANILTRGNMDQSRVNDSINRIADSLRDIDNQNNIDSSLAIAKQNANAVTSANEISKTTSQAFIKSAEASTLSAKMAEQALNEMRNSNQFSKDATMKEMRAYIVLDSMSMLSLGPNMVPIALFYFKNVGKTPATKIGIMSKMTFCDNPDKIDSYWFSSKNNNFNNKDIVFGTGDAIIYPGTIKNSIDPSVWDQFITGGIDIYASYRVRYSDVFQQQHITNVCVQVKGNGNRFTFSKFNDAD